MAVLAFGMGCSQGLSREGAEFIVFFLCCFLFLSYLVSNSVLLGGEERENTKKRKGRGRERDEG